MFGQMLRAYLLRAVVCVLFGIGIGFGWHFVDRAGVRTAASAATPPANQDAPNPSSPKPTARQEGPAPDVPRLSGLSDTQQSVRSTALDLSNDEKLALAALLTRSIAYDRYPSSPRVRTFQSILVKLDPKPPAQPPSPPKLSPPADAKSGNTRQREQRSNPSVPIADEIRARR